MDALLAQPSAATSSSSIFSIPTEWTEPAADSSILLIPDDESLAAQEAAFIAGFDLPRTEATTAELARRWAKMERQRAYPPEPSAAPDTEYDRGTTVGERRQRLRETLDVGEGGNLSEAERSQIIEKCAEYSDVFAFSIQDVRQTTTIQHSIPLVPGSVPTKPRYVKTLNASQKEFFHEQIAILRKADIIREVSPHDVTWLSNSTIAPKADHAAQSMEKSDLLDALHTAVERDSPKWRLCHAFMDLNAATLGANFPSGDLEAKIGRLSGKTFYSCFDMHSGYFAVQIRDEDINLTTFGVEDLGFFAYKVMPFGLTRSPSTFCQLIAVAFGEHLGTTLEAWVDDLAIADDTFASHIAKIDLILTTASRHRLTLNPAKCRLGVKGIVWCGSYLSAAGREPDKAKVQTVIEWPTPSNPYEALRFLNFAGYYRALIKNYARISEPLQLLTRNIRIKESARRANGTLARGAFKAALKIRPDTWIWGEDQISAFSTIKTALTSFPVLRSPDFAKPFVVETDASILGFGATIAQDFTYTHPETAKVITRRHPIAFISRGTNPAERRYSAFLLELVSNLLRTA
ncbi:hypothetical protein RQP46_005271 [Phenoliferia psychrophenolica]